MAEWIDVNERLPDRSGRYLTHCNVDGDSLVVILWFEKYHESFDDEVTHWQPLPEPPAKACANSEMAIEILEFIKQEYEKNYQDAGVKKYIEALQMGVDALRVKKGLKNGE